MCSPHCWFVLYCCESQFIASLQADHSKHSLINLFHNNCRYIDEILTVNDPNFLTFVKQFIPRNFLWMKLISQAIRVNFFKYTYPFFKVNLTNAFATKRRFFFSYRKFSLFWDDDVPLASSYGVYISQLVCLYICIVMHLTSKTVISW